MPATPRPIAFILASTDHGAMIVNRFDYKMTGPDTGFGVGFQLLNRSSYEGDEAAAARLLLDSRRRHFGDGVIALDLGANIGVFTVEWARHMTGWGHVVAVEAQERIFYALAGNIALNNCMNAQAVLAAVAGETGQMRIPAPNYMAPSSFGSLELRHGERNEDIGQPIDYTPERMAVVRAVTVDTLGLPRLDLMKIDVEGMEMETLRGASRTITRFHPIILAENLKTDQAALRAFLESFGYKLFNAGMNVLAIHTSDPSIQNVHENPPASV